MTSTKLIELSVKGGSTCLGTYGAVGYFAAAPAAATLTMKAPDVHIRISKLDGMPDGAHHLGDANPVQTVIEGMSWSGLPVPTGADANNFEIVSYKWTFPTGVVKWYGAFKTIQPTDQTNDPDMTGDSTGAYDVPNGDMTSAPNIMVQVEGFNADDLEKVNIGLNNQAVVGDHVFKKFYWTPGVADGNQDVTVTAVIRPKNDNDVTHRFSLTDTETLNVVRPQGTITQNRFGVAGVSVKQSDGFQWLQLDKDAAHPLPAAIQDLINLPKVGIDWTATVTVPANFGGGFGVNQIVDTDAKRTFKGLAGNQTTQAYPRIVTPQQVAIRPTPILDQLFYLGVVPGAGEKTTASVGQTLRSVDNPGDPLDPSPGVGNTAVSYEKHDSYTSTLMYNPKNSGITDTIWVPVGKLTWGWDGSATLGGGVWTALAAPQTGQTQPQYSTPAGNGYFPSWAHTVAEFIDPQTGPKWVKI